MWWPWCHFKNGADSTEPRAALVVNLEKGFSALRTAISKIVAKKQVRKLSLCEMLTLGEKRFVAVVRFEGERFLIGGSSNSVSLLTRLQDSSAETSGFARALETADAGVAGVQ